MSLADTWTAEYESTGQVVFPQRRNRLLIRLGIGLLLMSSSIWITIQRILQDDMGGVMGVLRLTALGAFVYLVAVTVWQLLTRRPVVTVNHDGIALGRNPRRGLLRWDQIASIGDPTGIPGLRSIPIHPVDRYGPGLNIPQDNVPDLPALALWLRTLHTRKVG